MSQTNPPKYSFPSGADYGENNLDQFPKSYWCDAKEAGKPFTGKFEGEEKYDFVITVMSKYGYGLWQNTSFQVNGKEIKDIASGMGDGFLIVLSSDVEAVHDWDAGREIKPATTTEDGEKLCTCNGCGKEEILPIPRLTPKANPLSVKANPLKVKGKTVTVKYNKLKKKAQTISRAKAITVTSRQGKLTYKKASVTYKKAKSIKMSKKALKKYQKTAAKKIKVNAKSGKITLKKGLKKGAYKVKIKVKAGGNAKYKASGWKSVTVKIKVK